MKNIVHIKIILFTCMLFIGIGCTFAQDVSFQASAPNSIVKGQQFKLTYTLKNASGESPKFANEIKGFDIIYGPSVAQSHRTSIINGKSTSESSEIYTFTMIANEEGTFTLPAATIKADGKTLTSNTVSIKVLPPDKNGPPQQNQGGGNRNVPSTTTSSNAENINPNDAFIRAIVTKTKVYEQEAFMITFRFYTTLNIRDIGKIEFPEFEGFIVEEQDLPANRQLSLEHFNGRNYYAVDLKKSVLFPQRSGEINIPSGKIEMVFHVPSGRKVQSFFGPQEVMVDAKKTMTTNPVKIEVSPLPSGRPASYANAVGTFNMDAKISSTDIKANDGITVTLDISGTGNMKLIRNPEIKLPQDFEIYDPKITNNFRISENGLTGTRTIEYLFIPRHQGTYTIPPIEFTYFDTKSKTYKTLSSPEYTLNVEKDPNAGSGSSVSYNNQTEVQTVKDIRFLKTGNFTYIGIGNFLFGSWTYWLWYILPLLLFAIAFVLYRKQIEQNSNIALMRTKKANKMAVKRLKVAGVYLKEHNKEKFYEEVLRAVWGYLSDKLLIPVADLSRENIGQELSNYGVSQELIDKFISILDTCEFARYAPTESDEAMDKLYEETINTISSMENVIKKRK